MKMAESRICLPSLTQAPVSLLSGLFYCHISLPGPLCWPPPPQQLLPPYPSSGAPRGAGVHLTEKTSCPGASEDEGSAVSEKNAFQKGQSTRPSRIDGYELWTSHPNWSRCLGAAESVPASPSSGGFRFSMHFCIHFAWSPFLC